MLWTRERIMEDLELIEQAKRGDGGAVRALYQRHARRVYAVVRRLAGDDTLAEDWAQDAWLRAIRALPTFRGDSAFTTWLHRIEEQSASVRPQGENAVLRVKLERAMEKLPEGMRRVLVLHDVEGYTHEEIAEMLGVNPGTCKSQLFKARARMRSLLSPSSLVPAEGVEACST